MPVGLPRPLAPDPRLASPRLAETLESQNWEERCPQPTPILFSESRRLSFGGDTCGTYASLEQVR